MKQHSHDQSRSHFAAGVKGEAERRGWGVGGGGGGVARSVVDSTLKNFYTPTVKAL